MWYTLLWTVIQLGFHGFHICRSNRNSDNSLFSREGGVHIAVKSYINPAPIHITVINVEQVFIRLSFLHTNLLVGDAYLPPNTSCN